MSDNDITLALTKREVVGKGLNKMRREGQVPAVIHNHGQDSIIVSANSHDLQKAYHLAGKHHPITLTIDKEKYLTIIKDVDFEPKKHQLRHVVFNAIRQNEKVEAEVPIVIEGDVPAEKTGLILINVIDHVTIEALPKDLIDNLTVQADSLIEDGDKIQVSDLKVPEGVTILTDPDQTIAHIETPRAALAEEEEAGSAEGEEGAAEENTEGSSDETESKEG